MPFKSKRQQRFMFAAESRNEIPKGTARRWAHETPNIEKLPERKKKEKNAMNVKTARALGRLHALDQAFGKEAAPLEPLLMSALRLGAPGAAGYYLAGPGYRTEGLLGGLLAGHMLGPAAARYLTRKVGPGLTAAAEKGAPELAAAAGKGLGEKWLGPVGMGAAGGYGAGRLLGLQNPYGLQPVFPGYGRENPYGMRPE